VRYAFISEEKKHYPVRTLCRVLEVQEQGYYAWCKRPLSERAKRDAELASTIRVVFAESRCRYGSPRIHDELQDKGKVCSKKRVARLMQQEGLRAKAAKKFRVTTDSSHGKPVAPNLINRNFTVLSPNEVWCGDITYLWTKEGWLYLAVFIDLYSRMVVGWSIGTRLDASLVTTAFRNAVARRRPKIGLIVHTDQGVQYTSEAFLQALSAVSAKQSMSRRGNCWDNAPTESFFHSFKVEAIYGEDLETRREMEYEVFDYIERFYNRRRKHSTLGYCSPINFEQSFRVKQKVAA
jgi:transposase InsO family protein